MIKNSDLYIVYCYSASLGLDVTPEVSTNKGRINLVLRFAGHTPYKSSNSLFSGTDSQHTEVYGKGGVDNSVVVVAEAKRPKRLEVEPFPMP